MIKNVNPNIINFVIYDKKLEVDSYIENITGFGIDAYNFFRDNIFKYPTLCGSIAVIKPDGNMLVRNGEFDPSHMLKYTDEKSWNETFGIKKVKP